MPVEPAYEELVARNVVLVAQNEVLRVEVGALRVQVAELVGEVETYRRLADRDSQNSSKPPSSDPAAKRRKAVQDAKSAKTSKRKPGKQPGGGGKHLGRVADPDVIVEHRPECCSGCGAIVDGSERVGQLRRQIFDIAAPRVVVTEHRAHKRVVVGHPHRTIQRPSLDPATHPDLNGYNLRDRPWCERAE